MKKNILYSILLLICVTGLHAGKEADNWYFGNKNGITFNTPDGKPALLTGGATYTSWSTSSMSDADGNILMYAAGDKVWNRNHEVMPNGSGPGRG